jgi:ubiquinone/menaquinone biosynthesis C-methylase UbiE
MLRHEYDTMRQVEDIYWWYQVLRREVVKDVVSRFSPTQPYKLLDAGCGTGGMLHTLHETRPEWQITGLDLSSVAVEHCQQRGLPEIIRGSVDKMPFPNASFDVVVSLDVLYHKQVSQNRALSEIARVLKPGGLLILNLPAFDVLRGRHDVAVHGTRRYTIKRIRELLRPAGFKLETAFYWNAWFFFPLLVWRLLTRSLKPPREGETKSDLSTLPPKINALLTAIGRLDFMVCQLLHLPFGTSVYSVGRKL